MDTLHKLMEVADVIDENFHEAFEKMENAFHWREDCRQMADWQKEMATAHANFNVTGCSMVRAMLEQMMHEPEYEHVVTGVKEMLTPMMAKWAKKQASLKAMIDSYK